MNDRVVPIKSVIHLLYPLTVIDNDFSFRHQASAVHSQHFPLRGISGKYICKFKLK